MGEFEAGTWITRILLYFFFLFIVVNFVVQATIDYDVNNNNVQFDDPGFGNSPVNIEGLCTGSDLQNNIGWCDLTLADTNTSCESLPFCVWIAAEEKCSGFSTTLCRNLANESYCRLARCSWITTDVQTEASLADKASVSSLRTTVNFITGINAAQVKVGVPDAFIYIFSFIFFWIPFIMLAFSFWFILPFFH